MGLFVNLQRSFANALFPSQFVAWIDAVSDFLDTFVAGAGVISIRSVVGLTDSLKSTTPAGDVSAIVDGYRTRGDGGGGEFFWDSTSTATDDGGTIINPTGHVGAGRWLRIYLTTEPINVAWFGAHPTLLDNTAPFNSAIDLANSNAIALNQPAILVQAGSGTYVFTTTVPLNTFRASVGFIGTSNGRTVLIFNLDGDCLIFRGGRKRIENFFIVNRRNVDYTARVAPVRIVNSPYTVVSNVESDCEHNSVSCMLVEQSYDGVNITAATNTSPVQITIAAAREWVTGDLVFVGSAVGNTGANGQWIVTRIDATHFILVGSVGNGVYGGSGVAALGEDSNLLTHLGSWYLDFHNLILNYITPAAPPTGYGLDLRVNANAIGVVNPPQQIPGTYTGSVAYCQVWNLNSEQKERAVSMRNAFNISFYGGQFLGSTDQIFARDSSVLNFIFTRHNQWVTNAFNCDPGSVTDLSIFAPSFFLTAGPPWNIGTLGQLGTQQFDINDDGAIYQGFGRRGGWWRPDLSGLGVNVTNSVNTYQNSTQVFRDTAGTGNPIIEIGITTTLEEIGSNEAAVFKTGDLNDGKFRVNKLGVGASVGDNKLLVNSPSGTQADSQQLIQANATSAIAATVIAVDNNFVSFDAVWKGSAFVAKSTSAVHLLKAAGIWSLYGDTGLTTDVAYSPTERIRVDLATGLATFLGDLTCSVVGGPTVSSGSGTPEGSKTAIPGSVYMDYTGGFAWVKNTGSGNTGWLKVTAT